MVNIKIIELKEENTRTDALDFTRLPGKNLVFFQDEIELKSQIVQSMISAREGKSTRIFARKCEVRRITSKSTRDFFLKNHLQGSGVGGAFAVGLFYEEELVSCMSIGKTRYSKLYKWELLRYATKLNMTVVGGASKILKQVMLHIDSDLLSYADRRYSDGGVYRALGFDELPPSKECYWYFRPEILKRYHRSAFQKHKLHGLLAVFDPTLTEVQNTKQDGLLRVFDAGNHVFVKRLNASI